MNVSSRDPDSFSSGLHQEKQTAKLHKIKRSKTRQTSNYSMENMSTAEILKLNAKKFLRFSSKPKAQNL